MAKFLTHFIKQKVEANELKNYNVNYITQDFKYNQADIVYKLKGEETYYLVEHQTKVDYSMAYRMLNYCVEIIKSVVQNKNINRAKYDYPKVIPIVIYTGNAKWTADTSFTKETNNKNEIDFNTVNVKYQLIDINKFEKEDLLKEKTMLANAMILEKCKNAEEVKISLEEIIKSNRDTKEKQNLKRIVQFLYSNIEKEKLEEILKIIQESESEENMSTIAERLGKQFINERKEGRKEGRTEGILQGIREIAEKMIKMNLENDFINQVTGMDIKKIEVLRKKIK